MRGVSAHDMPRSLRPLSQKAHAAPEKRAGDENGWPVGFAGSDRWGGALRPFRRSAFAGVWGARSDLWHPQAPGAGANADGRVFEVVRAGLRPWRYSRAVYS